MRFANAFSFYAVQQGCDSVWLLQNHTKNVFRFILCDYLNCALPRLIYSNSNDSPTCCTPGRCVILFGSNQFSVPSVDENQAIAVLLHFLYRSWNKAIQKAFLGSPYFFVKNRFRGLLQKSEKQNLKISFILYQTMGFHVFERWSSVHLVKQSVLKKFQNILHWTLQFSGSMLYDFISVTFLFTTFAGIFQANPGKSNFPSSKRWKWALITLSWIN